MKKMLLFLFATIALSACSSQDVKSPTKNAIKNADLTKREQSILNSTANGWIAAEYHTTDFDNISLSLEQYEYGIRSKHKKLNIGSTTDEEGIILFTHTQFEDLNLFKLTVNGNSITQKWDLTHDSSSWSTNPSLGKITEDEIVVGGITYDSNRSVPADAFSNRAETIEVLKDIPLTYFIVAQFKKIAD
ncbi:MAG: membrane lipoprotein lipid attachment site-containing protein [Lysinibacillus sp.]